MGLALCFKQSDLGLQGYVDVGMARYIDGKKSTTGYVYTSGGTTISWVSKLYVYTLGGTIISWVSKLQKIVAL